MNNTNLLFINKKGKSPFSYENADFSFELITGYIMDKNSVKNTYNQPTYHLHSYYELHMILEGSSEYEVENIGSTNVKKGDFVIFPPRTKHKINKETSIFSKFVITFKFSTKNNTKSQFYKILEKKLKKHRVLSYNKNIYNILQTIYQISQKKAFNYETSCFFLETSIIMELFDILMEKETVSTKTEYKDVRITHAVEYIKNNLNTALKVSDVAEYLNLSTRQFTKIFTEQTGTSPGKYIYNNKILYSTDLLINSDLSISEIAVMLAFPDAPTFIKSFKKSQGITPSKYRKLNK